MSTTDDATDTDDTDESNDEPAGGVRFITEYDTIEHELTDGDGGDDLRLVIGGDLGSDKPFAVALEKSGSGVTGESFAADDLSSAMQRERFAARCDRFADDADVSDEITGHLLDLADGVAAGEISVIDRRAKRVIDATREVDHHPDTMGSDWSVAFVDPETGAKTTATLSSKQWASTPSAVLDNQLPSSLRAGLTFAAVAAGEARDDRWQPVRRIWEGMAADADTADADAEGTNE